ncbi:MAG: FAD-binding protein [Mycolicibacterium sp.]|nr:FAD-binding protein [Mycolicibacterium sp.]
MSGPVVSTEVLVVGFGAAGACAALEARAAGADVLVVDRFNGGGATAISGGIIYAGGGTSVQRTAGVHDTADGMLTYLRAEVGDAVRPETLERFVATSPAMIDWLSGHGVPFDASVCPYKTSYPNNRYYLYYSGSECAGAFRDLTPPVQRGHRAKGRGASGKQVYDPLAASVRRSGARIQLHTRVTGLIIEGGRVIGADAVTLAGAPDRVRRRFARMAAIAAKPGIYYPPLRRVLESRMALLEKRFGQQIRIAASKGVILCAGGYIANTEMIATHAPQFTSGLALGTTGDDGAGIAMAVAAGGVTDHLDDVSAWRFITPPSTLFGAIVVDENGRRMIDESRYGAALGRQLVREHDGRGWILADAATMREATRQLPRESLWFQLVLAVGLSASGRVRGHTLAEVARKAGIDPAGLAVTVAAHNDAIAAGQPDPMGKPADFTRVIGDGPYTLLDISVRPSVIYPCPMFTLGGVRVDEQTGEVTRADGTPIRGLYAAGRTAVGICANSYVSGLSIADCVFSGRRAGAHAATAGD